jgi:predicted Rossmann fold flavoprotein
VLSSIRGPQSAARSPWVAGPTERLSPFRTADRGPRLNHDIVNARVRDADCDVLIVGAGAAGLATAIFARMRNPSLRVRLLDGARQPGAKILVSGGGRCNVTNRVVTERDFWGGPPTIIRRVLRALPVDATVRFFESAGVTLHQEHDGKLFPDSNRARDVLNALLNQATSHGVEQLWSHRVTAIAPRDGHFMVSTPAGDLTATRVVLASGGQSLPKSGSDGTGYRFAQALGHRLVLTTPALAPLLLAPDVATSNGTAMHAELSGVSLDATLTAWINGRAGARLRESLLWTHFGISGPVALNVSRHWLRAVLEGRTVAVTANFAGDLDFEDLERFWLDRAHDRPSSSIGTTLASLVPASVAAALLERLPLDPAITLAALRRNDRRRLTAALTAWPLAITGSRGYNYAEATAGGVDLREIDPATMESRQCPGLHLVGEILDVDGRIGGFNFQWAWSSASVAAHALARR